ncbi:MAG: prepilin-type N-terminal cleavage/methylation domain-containing protein [Oscillospiraceae bacterium]
MIKLINTLNLIKAKITNKKGSSLLETVIVIAIIGVLATIAVPFAPAEVFKAKSAVGQQNVNMIAQTATIMLLEYEINGDERATEISAMELATEARDRIGKKTGNVTDAKLSKIFDKDGKTVLGLQVDLIELTEFNGSTKSIYARNC